MTGGKRLDGSYLFGCLLIQVKRAGYLFDCLLVEVNRGGYLFDCLLVEVKRESYLFDCLCSGQERRKKLAMYPRWQRHGSDKCVAWFV
jgi:hypothetical protein